MLCFIDKIKRTIEVKSLSCDCFFYLSSAFDAVDNEIIKEKLMDLSMVSPRGEGSGIPMGSDLKLPPLSLDFDKFVWPQGLEDCQHFVGEDSKSIIHNAKSTTEPDIFDRRAFTES